MVGGLWVGFVLQHFSVSPSPLGTNWVLEVIGAWLGLGLGGFGTKGFGTGLDNKTSYFCCCFFDSDIRLENMSCAKI